MSESVDASAGSLPGPRTTSGPSPAPLLVAASLPQAPAQVSPRVSRPGASTVRPATAPGGRHVALKVIRDEITEHPAALAR
ncbi:hypothetical protein AB0P32_35165, partial [Streptomyces sp. NPDC085995]|uniref:hypothetical protein n=1 Tax=Streptomyces sp. NPDC085995 TaxID=3154861 RepID=UPI00341EE50E